MTRRMGLFAVLSAAATMTTFAQSVDQTRREQAVGEMVAMKQWLTEFGPVAAVESRVTTGRPYSAEATTEFTQVLGDGNRISRRTVVRLYRDSEGRTRREELAADGTTKSISIYDPVAHASYVLDPANRTATKAGMRVVYPASAEGYGVAGGRGGRGRGVGPVTVAPAETPFSQDVARGRVQITVRGQDGRGGSPGIRVEPDPHAESLGQKFIEGLQAEGTRRTTVIEAGAIGNQQPITVVSEQWFSSDLEVLVMTRHRDPRSGETSYTLSNIVRAEPREGLFDVPPDYTIRESSYMRTPFR